MMEVDDFALGAIAPYLDRDYYLAAHPDVAAAGMDPAVHYLLQGWRDGHDPSPEFDTGYYLRAHPDVAENGINPLLHFVLVGRDEGRSVRRPLHNERVLIERARPLSVQAPEWLQPDTDEQALRPEALSRLLDDAVAGATCLVIAVSHDDYATNWGGVQNLIREEAAAFSAMNVAYLHLSPAQPLPILADGDDPRGLLFNLRLGAQRCGRVRAGDLAAAAGAAGKRAGAPVLLIVHHLRGSAPEAMSVLASASSFPPIIWAHDYFTVCPRVDLLRNDVRYCGAPPPGSAACGICNYGADRAASADRVRTFFQSERPHVLAPSEAAARVWRRAGLPHRSLDVQPLARLILRDAEPRERDGQPVRIAHLGAPTHTKGWTAFRRLAERFADDPRYAFFQLATETATDGGPIRAIPMRVTAGSPEAMIEAVVSHRIDVVVNWASWPETFCYAAMEALAGGAFLLTHTDAGNVAALAEAHPGSAMAIPPSERDLHAVLEGASLLSALAAAPTRRGILLPEGGTARWLARNEAARGMARAILQRQSNLAAA